MLCWQFVDANILPGSFGYPGIAYLPCELILTIVAFFFGIKIGSRQIGPLANWAPANWAPADWAPANWAPGRLGPGKFWVRQIGF